MTTRESLHALVEALSEEELEVLWANLSASATDQGSPEFQAGPVVIDARKYPSLVAIWDNDDDAIFDEL